MAHGLHALFWIASGKSGKIRSKAALSSFGGRQSARMIHFLTASALVAFVVIHVVMVMASGTWNNMRSMITGYYAIKPERPRS
jgi:thiosulfate reductase cytochrome b subunit